MMLGLCSFAHTDGNPSDNRLPYSSDDIREHVVLDYGKRAVRIDADESISLPGRMKMKQKCFIVMSKKDYYLYVYEAQDGDTVLLARYDCAFGLKKGNKERRGGNIKAYGNYFLRLVTPGHSGIGIHGSTNNEVSVPGRASEGCIRLKDADIIDLRKNYAFMGMKVIIKDEYADDLPFEERAMRKQGIQRKRHLDPKKVLSNEAIEKAVAEKGREKKPAASNNKTRK